MKDGISVHDNPIEPGTVLESIGGVYQVQMDLGERVEASLRGKVKHGGGFVQRVVAGDRVLVAAASPGGGGVIERVEPRRSELVRAAPGSRRPKVVAANLDRILVVFSLTEPAFDSRALDRFLVLAEVCGIPPVLVLNKLDLEGAAGIADSVSAIYESIGYSVIMTSARSGDGLDRLRRAIDVGVSALVGPSGVGKSSLMNVLFAGLELRTDVVTSRGRRGRHTTVGSRLIRVSDQGWVADTPGFSDVTLWKASADELPETFPEFRGLSAGCRFSACTHSHEPECSVTQAVGEGHIRQERYDSYLALLSECK
jgi:ribosome biogenesis GTPase